MEIITIKMEREMLRNIDGMLKKHNYGTRTEFIREAIRDKIIDIEEKKAEAMIRKYLGISKTRTSDKKLREIREMAYKQLAKEKGWA